MTDTPPPSTPPTPVTVRVAFTWRNSVLVTVPGQSEPTTEHDVINAACDDLDDNTPSEVFERLEEDGVLRTWPEYSRVLRGEASTLPGLPEPDLLEGESSPVTPGEDLTVRTYFQFAGTLDVHLNAEVAAGKDDEALIRLAEQRIKPGDDQQGPEFARVLDLVYEGEATFQTRPQDSYLEDED